jgi:hypothetical protein
MIMDISLYAHVSKGVESAAAISALEKLAGVSAMHMLTDDKGTVLKVNVAPEAYTAYFATRVDSHMPQVPKELVPYLCDIERVPEKQFR